MNSTIYWRLCDDLTIFQAIMLILGYDPSNINSFDVTRKNVLPDGYDPLKTALIHAVKNKRIEGELHYHENYDGIAGVDINESSVGVKSLKEYLAEKNLGQGFFFPDGIAQAEYLDADGDYYAPKLAAALTAWKHVKSNPDSLRCKSPKQALEKWLRENAGEFGLTKDDGNPYESAIEEIAKVANWKPEGGANKTPTLPPAKRSLPTPSANPFELKVWTGSPTLKSSNTDYSLDDLPF